ncbi:MAG: hypothetical protein KTR32_43545 [Granulosicoccus sp.]|nr:hypothetical protein [Granulosicoccus sp.]
MKLSVKNVLSWAIALWACRVFLASLPYKFSGHPDTQHIFGTIGEWLKGFLGDSIGNSFVNFGAYLVGGFELLTSIVLLLPAILWLFYRKHAGKAEHTRAKFHALGGLMAAGVMAGAVFFHLFSPLGIEVLHQGQSDGGSLFYAAVSILILGLVLFVMNMKALTSRP